MARLQLSKADIATALRGLSKIERAELLALLEAAQEEEPLQPVDDRPPISIFLEQIRQEYAARSDDPEKYLMNWDAHEARCKWHCDRLMAGRPDPNSIQDFLAEFAAASSEARELAERDGFPDPRR